MHKDILESQEYSEIAFTPAEIQGHLIPQGESQLELKGVLKLHGTEHEISIPVSVHVDGTLLAASAHLVIPYVKWGLKNPSTFILRVSDKVDIDIRASGHLESAAEH